MIEIHTVVDLHDLWITESFRGALEGRDHLAALERKVDVDDRTVPAEDIDPRK